MNTIVRVGDAAAAAQVFGVAKIDICVINAKKGTVLQECDVNENREADCQ